MTACLRRRGGPEEGGDREERGGSSHAAWPAVRHTRYHSSTVNPCGTGDRMPHQSTTVAGVEVFPLCDAVGPMGGSIRRPLTEMFPGGRHGESDDWVLHFHCYLLRDAAGRTVLVDTG